MKTAEEILCSSHSGYGTSLYTTACYCPKKANFMEQEGKNRVGRMPVADPDKQNSLVLGTLLHYLMEEFGDVQI